MALFGSPPVANRLEELRRIVQKDPTSRQFLALAEEYRRHGKIRDAIIVLERGLQLHGTSVAAHVSLGKSYQQLDRLEDAARSYMNALRLDRENLVAIRHLAEVHLARGDKVEAIKKLKLYRGLKPGDKDVSELIAQIEAEVPGLKQSGSSGARPTPTVTPAIAPPISARLAALRLRAETPRSGVIPESPATRSASTSVPPPAGFAPVTSTAPPRDFMSPVIPSREEPSPALEKMSGESAGEAPAGAEKAPDLPPVPPRVPEPRARRRQASADLLAFTYDMPTVAETVAPPPPVSPSPPTEPEPAPFEDVPAVAPPPVADLFEAPAESASAAEGLPVRSTPALQKSDAMDVLEDPPTQPLFIKPPAPEERATAVVAPEMEPLPKVSEPEGPPTTARRPIPAKLRALAARFPVRSTAPVEDLRGCLKSLLAKTPGIRAAALTDMEGLPVLTVGRADEKSEAHAMEILVAEMTSFLKSVRRTTDEVGEGVLASLTLIGERGTAVVSRVNHDYSLILRVDPEAAIGEVRYEAARTAGALRSAVG